MSNSGRGLSGYSIWSHALLLTLSVAIPVLAFLAFLVVDLDRENEATLERRTVRDARTIAVSIERRLQDIATTLRVLATAPELRQGDLRTFHERARLALQESPYFVLLLRGDGQQLINTRVDFGTPLGLTANLDVFARALKSGRVEASDVFFGVVSEKFVFNVITPLSFNVQALPAALLITQDADDLGELIVADGLSDGWSAAILDSAGNAIAGVGTDEVEPGKPLDVAVGTFQDFANSVVRDDGTLVAVAALYGWPWRVAVWGPIDSAQPSILSNRGRLIWSGLILLMLAVLAAAFSGRHLQRSIEELAQLADRVGRGEIVSPIRSSIAEVNRVSIALTNASFDRSQAEQRIRTVANELTHRTKNMLTVVLAMIRQTARTHKVPQSFLDALVARLQGLGNSVDLLSGEDWKGVSLKQLITTQVAKFAAEEQLQIDGKDFRLKPEAVQALGMAFHELGTNALKYGALSVPIGRVAIGWEIEEGVDRPGLKITWQEINGPDVKKPTRHGFGTAIVNQHVSGALMGTATLEYNKAGFVWTLRAPSEAVGIFSPQEAGGEAYRTT